MESLFKMGFEVGLGFWFAYTTLEWASYGITKLVTKLLSKGIFL